MASHDIPIGANQISLAQLNERSREIFRQVVESYLATGEPVGSRNLSRIIPMTLSPASVRNVMSDLEQLGLVYAPHTSAGRLPTEKGLRFFVDALMQIGDLTENDRKAIEAQVAASGQSKSVENVLTEASGLLSGLTRAAGVVVTAKSNVMLKHVEFVRLEPERALVVLVAEDGQVENRVLNIPVGLPASALTTALTGSLSLPSRAEASRERHGVARVHARSVSPGVNSFARRASVPIGSGASTQSVIRRLASTPSASVAISFGGAPCHHVTTGASGASSGRTTDSA